MSVVDESEPEEQEGEEQIEPLTDKELEGWCNMIRRVRRDVGYWDRYKQAPKLRYGTISELGKDANQEEG